MKNKSLIVLLIAMVTGLVMITCASVTNNGDTEILTVGAKQADCMGVAPQKCMLVKGENDTKWGNFYQSIEGFTYQEGYEYKLKVRKEKVVHPPADASSVKYILVKEISREKK